MSNVVKLDIGTAQVGIVSCPFDMKFLGSAFKNANLIVRCIERE